MISPSLFLYFLKRCIILNIKILTFFYWPPSTILTNSCFSSASINVKQKFWVVLHLLMCVILFLNEWLYLNAEIFNFRCPKTAILAFWSTMENPLKVSSFQHLNVFDQTFCLTWQKFLASRHYSTPGVWSKNTSPPFCDILCVFLKGIYRW